MSFPRSLLRKSKSLTVILFLFCFSLLSAPSFSAEIPTVIAQGGSKSSGNVLLKAVLGGSDLKGMTKEQIIASYGDPWQKDTTGEKGRYDEKWIYSCETDKGLTYDCVFLYFMADRVVDVENF
ncbi:MAG: hypothetical protein AB1598_11400 [Thermodesulfobacteriota bacterium]